MSSDTNSVSRPWDDPETLRELYHGEGLTTKEVGQKLGCSGSTVRRHMKKHSVETRAGGRNGGGWNKGADLILQTDGGMKYRGGDGSRIEEDFVYIHRLMAVAEHGFDKVCSSKVIHENGILWDNRYENLRLEDIQVFTDEECLEWIELFVSEFGIVPTGSDISGWPGPSEGTYVNKFGSFTQAVREAGYTPRGDDDE